MCAPAGSDTQLAHNTPACDIDIAKSSVEATNRVCTPSKGVRGSRPSPALTEERLSLEPGE